MLWRSISGSMTVIPPDSCSGKLPCYGRFLAETLGPKLEQAVGLVCCGKGFVRVQAEKVVLCWAKLGGQPGSCTCGAVQVLCIPFCAKMISMLLWKCLVENFPLITEVSFMSAQDLLLHWILYWVQDSITSWRCASYTSYYPCTFWNSRTDSGLNISVSPL